MTFKSTILLFITMILSFISLSVSSQNYNIKNRRQARELTFYNFSKNEIKTTNDYINLNYDYVGSDTTLNLFVKDLFETRNLHEVSPETYTLIMNSYTVMKNKWNQKHNIPIETSSKNENHFSRIYYLGELNISSSFSTKVFIRHQDWGDGFYCLEEICITSDTANILSMSLISVIYSGDFGCCGVEKCTLNLNKIFHKTSIICGHLPQTRRGLIIRRNVKPFYTQYCINFKIDESTGKIRKLLRINA